MIVLFAIFALVLSGTSPEGVEFLAKNKLNPGVVELPSGLQYKILKNGYGLFHPNEDTACRVKFKGTFIDGKAFESTYNRKKASTVVAVQDLIPGWAEAMRMMIEGDVWELYIPSELAYGDAGVAGIPGGSVIIYKMELLELRATWQMPFHNAIPRCNATSLEGCTEPEKNFIEKFKTYSFSDLQKEFDRLNNLDFTKISLDGKAWAYHRIKILGQLMKEKSNEEKEKQEL